ncbi:MAG: DegT/DnrJ/EryC1/StrS family aminotransferase [Spirochaetaceae bacterium]|nr:DegT/DnrJ/EryC1/StrS family aminotransferase [Spirochaetaceae bacterium]
MIRQVPFFKPLLDEEEEKAVLRILRSGWLTTGSETLAFEKEFADFVGAKYAFAVNSATTGLLLAMDACGVGAGTSVITSPYTFASTALSAVHLGANLVYADTNADDYNISPESVEKLLAKHHNVKAIIPIHIAGNVCKMQEICNIAKQYNVKVIEDAAHAFPAKTHDGFAGTLGDVGVFSFYATKTITTGEGGMVCTNDDSIAKRIKIMRMHGIDRSVWERYTSAKASWYYDVVEAGWKANLPDILSAIGRVQLSKANIMYAMRQKIAHEYNLRFSSEEALILPPDSVGNAWHLYLLRIVPDLLTVSRDELIVLLQEQGLGMSMHFIPHFELTYFKNQYKLDRVDFPNAYKHYANSMTIPLWPGMTQDDTEYVVETVLKIIARCKK